MTRAYLRIDKQRWVKGPCLGLRPDLYDGDRAFLAAESCHEAQNILSVTEPANYPSSCGPGYWSAFQIGERYPNTCPVSEYGEALAEALATFINASAELES